MSRRLILNADDLGYDPGVTTGIIRSMREGCVSSTTFIVNSPFSEEAARQADGLAVGLHLNLVRFAAVSAPSRTLNEQDELSAAFVEAETEAQLERLKLLLGRRATHVDVHKHAHRAKPVLEGLAAVARRHELPVRSISPEMRSVLRQLGVRTNDAFIGDAGVEAHWTLERWASELEALPADGVVELMCHPGLRPSHLSSGYGAQREVELATFLSPRARDALTQRGLALSSWEGV